MSLIMIQISESNPFWIKIENLSQKTTPKKIRPKQIGEKMLTVKHKTFSKIVYFVFALTTWEILWSYEDRQDTLECLINGGVLIIRGVEISPLMGKWNIRKTSKC